MPHDGALITSVILARPMCVACISRETRLTESATRTALDVLQRAVSIAWVVTDRCHGCGEVKIVYSISQSE